MNNSRLLMEMFRKERWQKLVNSAVIKGIDKGILRKMCEPQTRLHLYNAIVTGQMQFMPPHMAQIPKDTPGEFRTVFVGEGADRLIQSIINDALFEVFPQMVHRQCKSYQTGLGTGKTVKELSSAIINTPHGVLGIKSDFHHYFDTVSIDAIMHVFDVMEDKLGFPRGTEPVINLLRRTWESNLVFDLEGNLIEQYCGIRQGNAVGSFLADCILYQLDEFMTNKYPFYVRYSDDCVTVGNPDEIVSDMNRIITRYGVSLNPKKIEILYTDRWFKFLGFNLRGDLITFSKKAIHSFREQIEKRTIKADCTSKQAIRSVMKYLYEGVTVGDRHYGWATRFLPVVNVKDDVNKLNTFVMDCIRAVDTGRKKIGGIGEDRMQKLGVVARGTGQNVTSNRKKWEEKYGRSEIDGYITLSAMSNALKCGQAVYESLIASALL